MAANVTAPRNTMPLPRPQTPGGWKALFRQSLLVREKGCCWERGTLFHPPRSPQDMREVKRHWREPTSAKRIYIPCNGDGVYCLQYDDQKIVSGNRANKVKVSFVG